MHIQFNPYGALVLQPESQADHAHLKAFHEGKVSIRMSGPNNIVAAYNDDGKPKIKLESTPVPNNKNTKP